MQSSLVNGKIVPPSSPLQAQLRHQQVRARIADIEADIARGPRRTLVEHEAWKRRAEGNLGWLREERRQLEAWMQGRKVEPLPPRGRSAAARDDFESFWRSE